MNSLLVVDVHLALLQQLWGERMLEKGCGSCCDVDIQDWIEEQTREENVRLVLTAETEGQTSCWLLNKLNIKASTEVYCKQRMVMREYASP